jgi:hypothetical protein
MIPKESTPFTRAERTFLRSLGVEGARELGDPHLVALAGDVVAARVRAGGSRRVVWRCGATLEGPGKGHEQALSAVAERAPIGRHPQIPRLGAGSPARSPPG